MEEQHAQIISFLDAHAAEQLKLVIELCNQNSYSYHKAGADKVGAMLQQQLADIFPEPERVEQTEVGNHLIFRNQTLGQAIYLVGHLDTVFPPEHPFQQCRREGELLFGPGTADMKGGLAVIIYALKALQQVNLLNQFNLVVIFNSDEELGSVTSRPLFLKERARAQACLVAECAGPNHEIVTSRNGKMAIRIDCTGRDQHVTYVTRQKTSAVVALAHHIIAIESLNGKFPGVSLNVGKIEGGLGPSTVPVQANCLVDLRWEQAEQREPVLEAVRQQLAHSVQPGCGSNLTVLNSRPAMSQSAASANLFQIVQAVGRRLGQEIQAEHRKGTSDANFFGAAGVPTLDGFGPVGQNDHTANEFINIASLNERTKLLALFLMRYGDLTGIIE